MLKLSFKVAANSEINIFNKKTKKYNATKLGQADVAFGHFVYMFYTF